MTNRKYRILCLDGGGIRGLLTTVILEKIHERFPEFLDSIDLVGGTSSGGMIALGLAAGLKPYDMRRFYEENAQKIFQDSFIDNLRDIVILRGAQYNNDNLKAGLEGILKKANLDGKTLKHLKKNVLITSFDLDNEPVRREKLQSQNVHPSYKIRNWKPKLFENFSAPVADGVENPDLNEKIIDVAMRTSAAPIYFPTYERFIDGAVVANHPGMCAIAQAMSKRSGSHATEDITLLSIGTGRLPQYVPGEHHDWGVHKWMLEDLQLRLLKIMMEGSVDLVDYQCSKILGHNYHRLNPILDRNIKLDGWQQMDILISTIEDHLEILDDVFAWIETMWNPT